MAAAGQRTAMAHLRGDVAAGCYRSTDRPLPVTRTHLAKQQLAQCGMHLVDIALTRVMTDAATGTV